MPVSSPRLLWDYLLSHNRMDIVLPWLEHSLAGRAGAPRPPGASSDSLAGRAGAPRPGASSVPAAGAGSAAPAIISTCLAPPELVERLDMCTGYVRDTLLRVFARLGNRGDRFN
jgi:hypothetical protein